jgi:hypothetical protein
VDGRAVGIGIGCAIAFSAVMSLVALGFLTPDWIKAIETHFDSYYTGIAGNLLTFAVGFSVARLFGAKPRDVSNLTLWTRNPAPDD